MAEPAPELEMAKQGIPMAVEHKEDSISADTEDLVSPDEGRHLIRSIDMRIVPVLCALYALSYMDRTNISNAKIVGMTPDLNLIGNRYNIILLVFFPTYTIFEIPSNAILRRVGVARYLSILVAGWGTIAMCSGFVNKWQELVGLRVLLGAFEAGFNASRYSAPGAIYLISSWYTRYEVQKRISFFFIGGVMISGFNGIISYALSTMEGQAGVRGWRWIFIVPGAITIAFAIPLYAFVSDFPEKAKWLKPHERKWFLNRLLQDRGEVAEHVGWKHICEAAGDWKVWALGTIMALPTIGAYALAFFSPSIIRDLGYDTKMSQILSSPPFIAATFSAIITAWAADKYHIRGPFIIGHSFLTIIGYILMGWGPNTGSKLTGVFFGVIGCYTAVPTAMAFNVNNNPGAGKRAISLPIMGSLGGLGGIIGSVIFQAKDAPLYRPGLYICFASMALEVVLALFMMIYFRRQNRKADEEDKTLEGVQGFRYTL